MSTQKTPQNPKITPDSLAPCGDSKDLARNDRILNFLRNSVDFESIYLGIQRACENTENSAPAKPNEQLNFDQMFDAQHTELSSVKDSDANPPESLVKSVTESVRTDFESDYKIDESALFPPNEPSNEMESEQKRRNLFRIVTEEERNLPVIKIKKKFIAIPSPKILSALFHPEKTLESESDLALSKENLLKDVDIAVLEEGLRKIEAAKKINSRVNRKRKRGPEPSNSALYYYRMDVLEEVADKYPNASPSDIVEVVQNQWEKLDKKSKEQYYRLAQMDQQRFDEEAKQYIPRSEGGTMKRPKRKKHPKAPKHPMSAYLYFASDHRAQVKVDNPDKDFTEIARILGDKWKSFDPEKKKGYEQKAEADKARYRKEKLAFEPCPLVVDSKKRKKHPLAPKHPLSGYLYFVANNRADFNKKYPDKDFTEVAKLLGEHWKNLGTKEKRKYQILAAADKKRYEEEKQKWQPPIEREVDTNYVVMPKKPMTAYSYWVYNQRSKITQSNPYVDKKELTRVLREKWNKIPEREKAYFNEKAELDRQRYQRELSMLPRNYRSNVPFL